MSVQSGPWSRSPSLEHDISQPSLLRAIDIGFSMAQNVSNLKTVAPSSKRSSPSFFHARNQEARDDDVQKFGYLAIHSAMAASHIWNIFC